MFQRRQKLSLGSRVGSWLWPRMGVKRTVSYYWHRLQRIPGTPSSIAAGFACGTAISMTPFYGTHMVVAGVMAWAIRGNIFASLVGAQASNPWTAPPLWFMAYYFGAWMLGMELAGKPPHFIEMFKGLTDSVLQTDLGMFRERVWPIFWPMLLGSIPMGIVVGLGSYFALLPVLKGVQHRRFERLRRKQEAAHAAFPVAGADV
jgi:uncharacterized protein (DUF2062 family)